MEATLAPAPDCCLFVLEDGAVLFCEKQQELHALNASAALAWIALEEGEDEQGIAAELSETFGITTEQAGQAVKALLEQWREQGWLAGTEGQRPAVVRPRGFDPGPLPSDPAPAVKHSHKQYRLLDTSFEATYGSAEQQEWVHPILAHLHSDGAAGHAAELLISSTKDGFLISIDGVPDSACRRIEALGPSVKAAVLRRALDNHSYLFQIHSGVVARGESCLLLPAIAGSGKTSLTAGLMHEGWSYLSDETAPLGAADLKVQPVPLALCMKPGAWPLLSPYYPEIERLPIHLREDGQHVRYLPPPPKSVAPGRCEGYTVKWIVFPAYHPEAQSRLIPLSKIETARRLLAECLSMPVDLDREKVERLVEWIAGLDGYELPNSSLQEAIGLVNGLASPGDA